jgi:DNA-directed RNA polymerase I, II, and III subunit RPABC5
MIVPIRCFTCGKPISHTNWNEYLRLTNEEEREHTRTRLSETKIRPLGHKTELDVKDVTAEYVALNMLGIRKMCCRRMYLGSIDIFDKL